MGSDWRYVDLEIDVLAFPDGTATLLDEDELEQRRAEGWIDPADAASAARAAADVQRDVADHAAWVVAGWRRVGASPPVT